jgi:hypothetical protein
MLGYIGRKVSHDYTPNERPTTRYERKDDDLTALSNKPPSYCSYILRCWQEQTAVAGDNPDKALRFSLEDPHTGERHGFPGAEALMQFLLTQIEERDTRLVPIKAERTGSAS